MTRSLAELRQYLAGEWLFDNDFKDTSGNGNSGVPTDIEWASTNYGLKPRFNGSSSFVNCGNDSSLELLQDATLSAVFRSINTGANHTIISKNYTNIEIRFEPDGRFNMYKSNGAGGFENYAFADVFDCSDFTNMCLTFSATSKTATLYVNGIFSESHVFASSSIFNDDSYDVNIGTRTSGGHPLSGVCTFASIHTTELSSAEALALYNATSGEYGVRIAEFSYQHDPAAVIPITADTVLQIGGKLAGDAVDTISDRALSNDATIHGAMPTGDGFLSGGRRFVAANSNYLDCGNDSSLVFENSVVFTSVISLNASVTGTLIRRDGNSIDRGWYLIRVNLDNTVNFQLLDSNATNLTNVTTGVALVANRTYVVSGIRNKSNGTIYIYVDGVISSSVVVDNTNDALGSASISTMVGTTPALSEFLDGNLLCSIIAVPTTPTQQHMEVLFNTLAVLPFWSINYRDFPDNVTTYTDRFPHSSAIIASGAFKVDDDKIQCTSAGTLTYSASHEFDGQEYITITIAGTEYSGTGTITQGNTTVSVAQGSNKITVVMGTGDTIDKIKIQFRATV